MTTNPAETLPPRPQLSDHGHKDAVIVGAIPHLFIHVYEARGKII
jgi:hypothetical protein